MRHIIYQDFDTINIPNGSIVLLCGVQNCGKSTWAEKHFSEECIINTDDIFYEILEKYSPEKISLDEAEILTSLEIKRLIKKSKKNNPYTVVDAVPLECNERYQWIKSFCNDFDNIVLIIFKINIFEVLSHPRKPESHLDDKWGITFPPIDYIMIMNHRLLQEIKNGLIALGVNSVYIMKTEIIDSVECNILNE